MHLLTVRRMRLLENFVLILPMLLLLLSSVHQANSAALQLSQQNFDSVMSTHELVFVNYYANWCRFSQMLEPIYDEFADKVANEPDIPAGKVAIAKVDCDMETLIAAQNQINKYPTLKLYRFGTVTKKEYRGQRSADAFVAFVKEQIASPLVLAKNPAEFSTALMENKKRVIVGYFNTEQSANYPVFQKLASILRDSCKFISSIGLEPIEKITFRVTSDQADLTYEGDLNSYESLYAWANERCTPLVREITFENAEELTEEGLPFLILFHKPEDSESVKLFEKEVQRQLVHLKNTINAVYADGYKFSHPLHHLGKTVNDLPILAIDSFRHMYIFPDYSKLSSEGNYLLQFVQDLHSGKLHREFHNGPDPTQETPQLQIEVQNGHIPKIPDNQRGAGGGHVPPKSTPPESMFIKLAPSNNRYSLKTDGEL